VNSLILNPHVLAAFTAVALTAFIYALEEIIFARPLTKFLRRAGSAPEIISAFASFFLTVAFFYGAVISPAWLRGMYAAFFMIACMAEYSYQKVMGRFAVGGDIEVAFISPPKMWRDAGALFLDMRVFIAILVFILVLWLVQPASNGYAGTGSLGVVILGLIVLRTFQRGFPGRLNYGPSPIQAVKVLLDYGRMRLKKVKRESLAFRTEVKPSNNIVLIVDESVRGDHLSVNGYGRSTSPHMEELAGQAGLFHNWGIAVPGATCSNVSNGLLGTGLQIKPGNLDFIYERPTLFQYAKAMGYRTFYLDVQTPYLWNGINKNDLVHMDGWIKSTEFGGDQLTSDFLAAERIRHILDDSAGNFIIINKRGVHYLYEDNYPPEAEIWKPIPSSPAGYESHPDQTTNAYDNAIRYNVDGFFKHLIPEANRLALHTRNTIYIYTSDHSETLYEDGARVAHCTGTRHESRVPLIILGKLPGPVDTSYRASHSNILPTILDLMNAPPPARPHEYDLSLLKATAADSKDRLFFDSDGTIVNHDALERNADSMERTLK